MVESSTDKCLSHIRSSVSLVIPRRAEYLSLCRLVVGALGMREAVDEETIADMKVVVTEACTCFVLAGNRVAQEGGREDATRHADGGQGELRLDIDTEPQSWTITVSDPEGGHCASRDCCCEPGGEEALGLTIIEALVDGFECRDEEQGSVFRLVKRLSSPATSPA